MTIQKEAPKGSLRDTMPITAAFIDELRQRWTPEKVDAVLRRAKAGQGVAHFAEIGADGELRQWGTAPAGRTVTVVDGVIVRGGRR
jgi:hypothetical protein